MILFKFFLIIPQCFISFLIIRKVPNFTLSRLISVKEQALTIHKALRCSIKGTRLLRFLYRDKLLKLLNVSLRSSEFLLQLLHLNLTTI